MYVAQMDTAIRIYGNIKSIEWIADRMFWFGGDGSCDRDAWKHRHICFTLVWEAIYDLS
jgi:hypothetical protein